MNRTTRHKKMCVQINQDNERRRKKETSSAMQLFFVFPFVFLSFFLSDEPRASCLHTQHTRETLCFGRFSFGFGSLFPREKQGCEHFLRYASPFTLSKVSDVSFPHDLKIMIPKSAWRTGRFSFFFFSFIKHNSRIDSPLLDSMCVCVCVCVYFYST